MSTSVQTLYGLCCPACGSDAFLQIWIETWADLSEDGTEPFGDHDWDNYSACRCANCGHHSAVERFRAKDGEAAS